MRGLALSMACLEMVGGLIAAPAIAMPLAPAVGAAPIVLVAQGCGPGAWRGPWGHCRNTPYSGPLPGGGWRYRCPPGSWRGPWGHCRYTPYHGRLPGGGYR